MQLTGLLSLLRDTVSYGDLLASLQSKHQAEFDILRAGRPYLLATLAQDWQGVIVYVTPQVKRAYNVSEQLPVWLGLTVGCIALRSHRRCSMTVCLGIKG